MSFGTTFKTDFKNFGHAIAIGAKYFVQGLDEIVKEASKAEAIAPEVELLVGALAGPQAAAMADLAFHALGDVAAALQRVDVDANAIKNGQINVQMDLQTINDIKAAAAVIQGLIKAKGLTIPTPVPAPWPVPVPPAA
jgi:hypothetical protein